MKTTLPPFSLLCAIFALVDARACLVLLYCRVRAVKLEEGKSGAGDARAVGRYEDSRMEVWEIVCCDVAKV